MTKASGKTTTRKPPTGKSGRTAGQRGRGRKASPVAAARGSGRIGKGTLIGGALIALFALVVLFFVYTGSQKSPEESASGGGSGYEHVAGEPGPGEKAPDFTLASSEGGQVSLSDFRGENVLLYFQEGLMCQPCFDQITDLESNADALRQAGIDRVISITSDPVQHLARKSADMNLSTPVLSDPDLAVIRDYDANSYGMMGDTRAGHSFLLVDPEGTITWRADYGGKPDYTMYLPVKAMLADLKAERTS